MKTKIYACPLCGNKNLHFQKPIVVGEFKGADAAYTIAIPFLCDEACTGFIEYHHEKRQTKLKIYGEKDE